MANKDTLQLIEDLIAYIKENTQGQISADILRSRLIDLVQSKGLCEVFQIGKKYYQNEFILFSDNNFYKCLLETEAGQSPTTHPDNWLQLTNSNFKIIPLINNTPDSVIIGDKTVHESILIDFSIKRGSLTEVGNMIITNKETDNWVNVNSYFDDCGFIFTKTFSGNNILFNWTDDLHNGSDATLKMDIKNFKL